MNEEKMFKYKVIDESANIKFVIEKFKTRFYFLEPEKVLVIRLNKTLKSITKEYLVPEFLKDFLTPAIVILVTKDWDYFSDSLKRAYIFKVLYRLKYADGYFKFKPYEIKTFKELFNILGMDPKDGEKNFE